MEKTVLELSKLNKKDFKKVLKEVDIHSLLEIQNYLDDKYYNSGEESGFSDEQYDILKDIIENNQNYKHKVGSKIRADDNKVKLPIWLGSLDKIKAEESDKLSKWLNKHNNEEYTIESKLDGVSCLLTYKNNILKLYTRGDGYEGSDITHLTEYISSIPKTFPTDISVRGELIIKEQTFKDKYKSSFANPRNMVSGIVNSKSLREGVYDIDFVAYEKINDGTIQYKPSQQIEVLKELNFIVVETEIVDAISIEILSEKLIYRKHNSEYEIDGIIVQADVPYVRNTSGNPSYAFAFKMTLGENLINVEVEDVEWNVSKWGVIKPRIRIKPVNLNGVTITYTSGFNAKYIFDNNIGKGTILKLTRSGDVIPFILEVIKSTEALLPEEFEYKWNETGVDIYTDEHGSTSCVKLLSSFFSTLKIKHVSEATISKMYDHGLDNIIKIVSATKDDFEKIQGFGKRLSERTYDNIHNGLQNITLSSLFGASGIFGMSIGVRKVENLLNNIPDLLDIYKNMSNDELTALINSVDGFSDKTTKKIIENLPWADKFYNNIKPYISLKTTRNISNDFKDMKIVFSGFRDKELEELIKDKGGKVTTSVSKNTNLLVVDDIDTSSSKYKKASELGIKIIQKDEFILNYL